MRPGAIFDKLERHFGFLAIPNLILAIIGGQALATLAALQDQTIPLQLMLDPAAVAAGQWWRLLTWVIVPATQPLGVLLAVFYFMFLFMAAQHLEAEWGAFKSTLYLLLGIALPSLGAMLLWQFMGIPILLTGWYFSATVMLAFAALAPDYSILLMFILPVKMKWWAWFIGALLCWDALTGGLAGFLQVAFGVGNYLLFFLPAGIHAWRQQRQSEEGRRVFAAAKREVEALPVNACSVCGKGRGEADLRLCTCERCGDDGRFFCTDDLKPHLAKPAPEAPKKLGRSPRPKQKRKS